jgi:hypothetical protein
MTLDKQAFAPQAFPYEPYDCEGMTLRDYFAAHALVGILAAGLLGRVIDLGGDVELAQKQVCAGAFKLADVMLATREATP